MSSSEYLFGEHFGFVRIGRVLDAVDHFSFVRLPLFEQFLYALRIHVLDSGHTFDVARLSCGAGAKPLPGDRANGNFTGAAPGRLALRSSLLAAHGFFGARYFFRFCGRFF